ncbi:CesT family type III secretion system chaperone [Burkholderia metallica]|uniref:CesT family type III secretion system chaperone n=1 Tax=Burkholderia metallica TaxID=488729 RepID=UPI001CF398EA|nr:CesT family type III secretion system chaperone [Burkholderia metallica]MCA8023438.1 CesT family type III secretion system chaperone [Burkholderia metallica]
MTDSRYLELVAQFCATVGLHDVEYVQKTGFVEVDGFEVQLVQVESDEDAIYANFHFGTVTAGRTLHIFRLMLEANLLIYAQDQAQLGIDVDTDSIVLILRLPFDPDFSGADLADILIHYADHGRYWRKNIIESSDEMFEGIASGEFLWLRA